MEADKKRKATLMGLTCILKISNIPADILQSRADFFLYICTTVYISGVNKYHYVLADMLNHTTTSGV